MIRKRKTKVLYTVERPDGKGVFIDDLKETQGEALAEVERRGGSPWCSVRIEVPTNEGK